MSSLGFSRTPGRRVLVAGAGGGRERSVVAVLRAAEAEGIAPDLARVPDAHLLQADPSPARPCASMVEV